MKDHYRIRLGIFEPDQKAKAVVQLVHGFGEYTGHYLYLINELVNAGFVCLMHDQRGPVSYTHLNQSQRTFL